MVSLRAALIPLLRSLIVKLTVETCGQFPETRTEAALPVLTAKTAKL
jgi:hypothetical protein